MKRPSIPTISVAFVALFAVAACSSGRKAEQMTSTGWLGPLSGFERVSGSANSGVFVRRADGETPKLATVYIETAEISVAAGSNLDIIDPAHIAEMRRMLTDAVRNAVGKNFSVATEKSPASHVLRAALTNVIVNREGNFADVTPRSALRFGFGIAALEGELRDPGTNARRAATVALPAKGIGSRTTPDSWPDLAPQLDALAAQLAGQLDAARAALEAPPKPPAKKS